MCPRVKEDSGCCPIGIIYIYVYTYTYQLYIYIVTIYIYILLHVCPHVRSYPQQVAVAQMLGVKMG